MTRPAAAAFDFDGTITRRDTLVPFLAANLGPRAIPELAKALPELRHGPSTWRSHAKLAMLRGFRGRPVDELDRIGREYAATLPESYRPDTVALIDEHREAARTLVLVTASLGVYARPAGEALGFDHVIAVELESDEGVLTGATDGPNVRGEGKSVRLRALLAELWPGEQAELWAYGNSSGDAAMLAMADHPTWIGRRARTT